MSAPPGVAYINQEFVPMEDAKISVLDWGFLHSDATYDVVHVWNGRFFRLDAHIDRFLESAARIRLSLPVSRTELARILAECTARSGHDDAYVEMILTRGVSPTFSRDPRDADNQLICFSIPFGWILRPEQREKGADQEGVGRHQQNVALGHRLHLWGLFLASLGDIPDVEHQQQVHQAGREDEGAAVLEAGSHHITDVAGEEAKQEVRQTYTHRSQRGKERQWAFGHHPAEVAIQADADGQRGENDDAEDHPEATASQIDVAGPWDRPGQEDGAHRQSQVAADRGSRRRSGVSPRSLSFYHRVYSSSRLDDPRPRANGPRELAGSF